jgi:hypothetical protein
MSKIDCSSEAWEGKFAMENTPKRVTEDESLWYIFNTLENPDPKMENMNILGRRAVEDILLNDTGSAAGSGERSNTTGLKTALYPYQRRSAATMIQREVQPAQSLDPRLQPHRTPAGEEYYYDKEEGIILREKRLYSEACGGILAETMGCGKTLICLAVILATRGHFPQIPVQYQEAVYPVRKKTGSLIEMAAAAAGRHSLPWKAHFDQLRDVGLSYERCVAACERNRGAYIIPPRPSRYKNRDGAKARAPPTRLRLCSGSLIIVPPNLVDHWKSEVNTHTEGLNVLVLRTSSDVTPSADELLKYDIVLFSRTRFEKEANEIVQDYRSWSKCEYDSPLKQLHWLRIIVDEGHNVAGHGHKTNVVHLLDQIHVERRWVVSGTPSTGLYGVEVSLASQETQTDDTECPEDVFSVLQSRKETGNAVDEEFKDLDKLRLIVVGFLNLQPWANSRADDRADWSKYIKPVGPNGKRRKSPSLRATLQSLVVRHRLDVINRELPLPKLYNKVVYLEPTFYDKLSINSILFSLAVNAVTSERIDKDYMFHPSNRKHLALLVNNLRQAGFWWTGIERSDLSTTIELALKYLDRNSQTMTQDDMDLLHEGIQIAQKALDCKAWNELNELGELGILVENFPNNARGLWALESSEYEGEPLLLGISQVRLAQKFITSRLRMQDPADGLAGAGIRARQEISQRAGKTSYSLDSGMTSATKNNSDNLIHKPRPEYNSPKKGFSKGLTKTLPSDSPLARTKIVATTSAKLTYLLERVLELHKTEKIIIFYENNNTAFWIAEGLEMLGIEFRIYANTLRTSQKAMYLSLFDESEAVRVLVMDLRQASHGLHVASASRVFIVNPIWQPNVESQAIKRAHRIGQTNPVFVETLILQGTLEDRMLKRRKEMSNIELQHAERDMLDDSTMSSIIQKERFIPIREDEALAGPSYLKDPPGLFDRHKLPVPDKYVDTGNSCFEQEPATPTRRKRTVTFRDIPCLESDASQGTDGSKRSPKKRRSTPEIEMATENGIIVASELDLPSPRSELSGSMGVDGLDDANDQIDDYVPRMELL